ACKPRGSLLMQSTRVATLAAVFLIVPVARAAEGKLPAKIEPILKAHCITCHSGDKPKGDLDLSVLTTDFAKDSAVWKTVLDRLMDGSMPPEGKPRPTADEQKAVTTWIGTELTAYQTKKNVSDGRARLRRLSRIEYVNTLRDLLGVE